MPGSSGRAGLPSRPWRGLSGDPARGVAAPSANRFGRVSPTRAHDVLAEVGSAMDPERDLVVDGGPCAIGVESTIVDCTATPPRVLRLGAISQEQVDAVLAGGVERVGGGGSPWLRIAELGDVRAPGTLESHYAPVAAVLLVEPTDFESFPSGRRVVASDRPRGGVGGRHAGRVDAVGRAGDGRGVRARSCTPPCVGPTSWGWRSWSPSCPMPTAGRWRSQSATAWPGPPTGTGRSPTGHAEGAGRSSRPAPSGQSGAGDPAGGWVRTSSWSSVVVGSTLMTLTQSRTGFFSSMPGASCTCVGLVT